VADVLSCTMNDQSKDCLLIPTLQECQDKYMNDNTRPIKSCAASETRNASTLCGQVYVQLTSSGTPTTPPPPPTTTTTTTTDPPSKLKGDWRCFQTTAGDSVVVHLETTACLSNDQRTCVSFPTSTACATALLQAPSLVLDTSTLPLPCANLTSPLPAWCPASPSSPLPAPSLPPHSSSSTIIIIVALAAGIVVCVGFLVHMKKKKTFPTTRSRGASSFMWPMSTRSNFGRRLFQNKPNDSVFSADHIHLGNLIHWRLDETQLATISTLHTSSTGLVSLARYLGKVVVVKQPLECDRSMDIMQAFVGEIELMIRVQSPHVIQVVGVSYMRLRDLSLVLEYMERGDLQTYLSTTKLTPSLLNWPQKLAILKDIVSGLGHIHALGVIHRDIKARNILLSHDLRAKLTDFGVARQVSGTTMTQGIGSLQWTAPEVLEGGQYTAQADMYSLGILLSELDTHQPPYATDEDALSDIVLLRPSLQCPPERNPAEEEDKKRYHGVVGFSTSCPHRVQKLATLCLALDPNKRPTPAQVLQMLA
ncbi:hypothetical protein DYB25_005563, partial [Aphanomyces astaci]